MELNRLDRLGDWNPQLFRELKGRLKPRNAAIALSLSLFGQLLVVLSNFNISGGLESLNYLTQRYPLKGKYCRLWDVYILYKGQKEQLREQWSTLQGLFHYYSSVAYDPVKIADYKAQLAQIKSKIHQLDELLLNPCPADAVDVRGWWSDVCLQSFVWLGIGMVFVLLVAGTYLLIEDLGKEERNDTLNFVRLSPQSAVEILVGKILGVPCLVYLAIAFALPLYFFLGLYAQVPLATILTFLAVVVAGCAFFFSAALVLGLSRLGIGGLKPWLGGGGTLLFLIWILDSYDHNDFLNWLKLFAPFSVLGHLLKPILEARRYGLYLLPNIIELGEFLHVNKPEYDLPLSLQWFHLNLGATAWSLILFALLNYVLWTGWIWQVLNRQFRNPHGTLLSKPQSYGLLICLEIVQLGLFANDPNREIEWFVTVNCLWLLCAIALLSPRRQTLQDWVRHRRSPNQKKNLIWDLIGNDKSPIMVAMAIHCAIASIFCLILASLVPTDEIQDIFNGDTPNYFFLFAFFLILLLIVTTLVQLVLMMRVKQPVLWAIAAVAAFLFLPGVTFGILEISPSTHPGLYLFSTFPFESLKHATTSTMVSALLVNFGLLALLNLKLVVQLRVMGASEFKKLTARDHVE